MNNMHCCCCVTPVSLYMDLSLGECYGEMCGSALDSIL